MPLVGLEPTSSSPEKQGFSAGRGTDSGTVTDAGKAGDLRRMRLPELEGAVEEFDCGAHGPSLRKWRKILSVSTAELSGQQIQLPSCTDLPEGWVTTKGVSSCRNNGMISGTQITPSRRADIPELSQFLINNPATSYRFSHEVLLWKYFDGPSGPWGDSVCSLIATRRAGSSDTLECVPASSSYRETERHQYRQCTPSTGGARMRIPAWEPY